MLTVETVHPRAGGEHCSSVRVRIEKSGSSPRGRGTSNPRRDPVPQVRFIPARAGNICRNQPAKCGRPVHPRAGGEHNRPSLVAPLVYGSSPRGRGTSPEAGRAPRRARFIPARAGNISGSLRFRSWLAVHPRAGGEHAIPHPLPDSAVGSSPRGRGTSVRYGWEPRSPRFIPARAGNMLTCGASPTAPSVHPRAGGEHASKYHE